MSKVNDFMRRKRPNYAIGAPYEEYWHDVPNGVSIVPFNYRVVRQVKGGKTHVYRAGMCVSKAVKYYCGLSIVEADVPVLPTSEVTCKRCLAAMKKGK